MIDETTKFNRAEGYYKRDASMGNVDGAWKNFVARAKVQRSEMDNFNTPDLDQGADSILRPGETLEDDFDVTFRKANAEGGFQQLVKNTDNGSRPGYAGKGGTDSKTGMGFQKGNTMGQGRAEDLTGKPSINVEGKNQHTSTQKTTKEIQAIIDANPDYRFPKNFFQPTKKMLEKGMKKLLTFSDTENPDVVFQKREKDPADPEKITATNKKRNLARINLEGRGFAVKSAEGYQLHHIMPLAGNEKLNTGDYAVVSKEMNAKMSKYDRQINKLVNEAYGLDFNKTENLKRLDEINNSLFDILKTVKKDLPKEYKGLLGFNKLTPVLDTFDDQGKQILFAEPQGIDYTKSIAGSKGTPVKDVKTSDIQKLVNEAPKSDLKNLMKKIENTDPKLAKKVSIQLNSGLDPLEILKEIRKIPGIDKLGRGFMKVGGPFELAFIGLDAVNELSKGKTGEQSLKTALSNFTFGAYEGNKIEDINVLLNTAKNLNIDSTGFNELLELQYLEKELLTEKGNLQKTFQYGMDERSSKKYQDIVDKLQNEFDTKSAALQEKVDINSLVKNYTNTTKSLSEQQFDKSKKRLLDSPDPTSGVVGNAIYDIVDYKTYLPQNFLQNSITKVIPNTLRKLPFGVGSIFEPTSDRAKLFDSSKEEKEIRLGEKKNSVLEELQTPYYPKAEGGIIGLRSKYEYKK